MTTTEQLGVLAPPAEELQATALSEWQSLCEQITLAQQESATKSFNYRDAKGNKEARSYIHGLRKLAGSVENARIAAKAVYLERGRTVDAGAKKLDKDVRDLIAPHEEALNAIQAEEQARVATHRTVLEFIAALPTGITTAAEADARIAELKTVDTTTLEEFAAAGANRQAEALELLQALRDTLQQQEAERAELEALRREKEDREAADRAEQLRLEGEERERNRAEQERQQEADAARQREAQALADVEAAKQREADAERRAAEAEERERLAAEARQAEQAREREAEQAAFEAQLNRKAQLIESLIAAMKGKKASDVAVAMVQNSFHPAVFIDWSKA